MNDLISRREVSMILDKYRVPDSVYHEINKLPEFSADREKGEWIEHKTKNGTVVALTCPKCLKSPKNAVRSDFCPNCGADMREPEDIIHKAIDNTIFAEEAYPNIKEELRKAVDMAEPKGEKGTE